MMFKLIYPNNSKIVPAKNTEADGSQVTVIQKVFKEQPDNIFKCDCIVCVFAVYLLIGNIHPLH